MRIRLAIFGAYWFCAFMLVPTEYAWGYIDPATTTYIIQIAAAIVITLGVSLGVFLYKFQMIVTNIKVSAHAFFQRLRKRQEASGGQGGAAGAEDGPLAQITEEEALERGIIDYALPARKTYPALAPYRLESDAADVAAADKESAAAERPRQSRLSTFAHWLWDDDRTFKSRALVALLTAAGIAMTFVIFGMLDSVLQNEAQLNFSFGEIVGPVLLVGLAVFAVLAAVLLPLRGRVFDFAVCLLLSFLICGYLQSTFLNSSIGMLMGLPLGWDDLGVGNVIANLAVWAAVFIVVFCIGFIHKDRVRRFFKKFSYLAPALLVAVQLVALLSILPPADEWNANQRSGTMSTLTEKDMFKVSANENVIVIILDMLDEEFIDGIVDEDPTFFDDLDGFTRFTNNVSTYNTTFPSVINLMTNAPLNPNIPIEQYTEEAYANGTFVADIRKQGYSSDLFIERTFTYSDGEQLAGLADNIEKTTYSIDTEAILGRLARLSALKCSPLAFKAEFYLHPSSFDWKSLKTKFSGATPFLVDDPGFYVDLKEQGLQVVDDPGHFAFYHLNGSHYPWYMDAKARPTETETTGIEQTKGSFFILDEYFRQMKELGIYEDATIIITGDHPTHLSYKTLDKPMLVGLFVKPSGAQGTPLRYSKAPVSIQNLRATCVQAAGGDSSRWGATYFEVPEDAQVERHYFNRYAAEDGRAHYIAHYRIGPDATDWDEWELVEQIPYDSRYWM